MKAWAPPIKNKFYFKILSNLWIGISHLAEIWKEKPESDIVNKSSRFDSQGKCIYFSTIFFSFYSISTRTHSHLECFHNANGERVRVEGARVRDKNRGKIVLLRD